MRPGGTRSRGSSLAGVSAAAVILAAGGGTAEGAVFVDVVPRKAVVGDRVVLRSAYMPPEIGRLPVFLLPRAGGGEGGQDLRRATGTIGSLPVTFAPVAAWQAARSGGAPLYPLATLRARGRAVAVPTVVPSVPEGSYVVAVYCRVCCPSLILGGTMDVRAGRTMVPAVGALLFRAPQPAAAVRPGAPSPRSRRPEARDDRRPLPVGPMLVAVLGAAVVLVVLRRRRIG